MHPLGKEALRLRRLQGLATTVALTTVALAADLGLRVAGAAPPVPPVVAPIGIGVVVGTVAWALAGLVHRSWAWALEADHLRVDQGVVVRRSALVPRHRVQHVSTRVGPLQRQLGLATIVVHTAGARTPNVVIEHLEGPVADELRANLAIGAAPVAPVDVG